MSCDGLVTKNTAMVTSYCWLLDVGVELKYRISRPIRRTVIFSLEILEKNNDECILILVIYWEKTGLLHILLQESKPFTRSDA
jgi:hypothetical protein